MPSNEDPPNGGGESTKEVERRALDVALNQSVDSKKVLERVNSQVAAEVHAEGTAQIDRNAVERYLEAARSGEFDAIDEAFTGDDSEPEAAAEPAKAPLAAALKQSKLKLPPPRPKIPSKVAPAAAEKEADEPLIADAATPDDVAESSDVSDEEPPLEDLLEAAEEAPVGAESSEGGLSEVDVADIQAALGGPVQADDGYDPFSSEAEEVAGPQKESGGGSNRSLAITAALVLLAMVLGAVVTYLWG